MIYGWKVYFMGYPIMKDSVAKQEIMDRTSSILVISALYKAYLSQH